MNRLIAYGAAASGGLTLATISLIEDHPAVLAASFPVGALTFVVIWWTAWRPRRGRS